MTNGTKTSIIPASGGVRWGRLQWYAIVVALVATLTATASAWLIVHSLVEQPTDLRVYATASQWLWSGLDPYSEMFEEYVYQGVAWTNPVPAAVAYVPLSWGVTGVWDVPWLIAQLLALLGVVVLSFSRLLRRIRSTGWRWLAAVGLALGATGLDSVTETIALGQVNLFLILFVLWDTLDSSQHPWIQRIRRWVPQGVAVGVMSALKLTPGLIIIWWLLTRQVRAAVTAIITFLTLWGAAFIVAPAVTWRFFADGVIFDGVRRLGSHVASVENQSLMANMSRWVDTIPAPMWMWLPGAVIAVIGGLAAGVYAYRRGQTLAAVTLVMLPTLLANPVGWTHHGVWLIPAFAVLLGDACNPRRVFFLTLSMPLWFVHTRTFGATLAASGITFYYTLLYVIVFLTLLWDVSRSPISSEKPYV